MDWRLDVEVAKRTADSVAIPNYSVRIDTVGGEGGETGAIEFTADAAQMRNLRDKLVEVLKEHEDKHAQRFVKYLNWLKRISNQLFDIIFK